MLLSVLSVEHLLNHKHQTPGNPSDVTVIVVRVIVCYTVFSE
nr:MAG TPA: hypothetical protein [Caudoviricetes sp.]